MLDASRLRGHNEAIEGRIRSGLDRDKLALTAGDLTG
jgi:hypothetical protein